MQTGRAALGALLVALFVTAVARYMLGIKPDRGLLACLAITYVFAALGRLLFPAPSWDSLVPGFAVVPALLAAVIPWLWWRTGPESEPQLLPPACNALVRLSLVNREIQAKPYRACLHLGRSVDWQIEANPDDDVELHFKSAPQMTSERGAKGQAAGPGPFVQDPNNPSNPSRGVYRRKGPGDIDSNTAELLGRWEYTVTWRQPGLPPVTTNSPVICIRR